ncbi:sugar ABC transporter substrate-binding protein [Streptomyces sp. NPDC002463]|uniref:sugar ABC transporter substrate-binding protein n=1 Tax=Streptomyces sp. NPDC002463 TaxID=3364645 RepID=UPI00368370FA
MKFSRTGVALVATLAATVTLGACSSSGTGGPASSAPQSVPTVKGDGKNVTVWVMEGDYSDQSLKAINSLFAARTGAKADVQIQSWDGISTKITTALATSTPPDVLDLGNTQVASFAANGGLKDLTPYAKDLQQGQTWLAGLVEPATVDGRLYGVPGFAGARAVIYNKEMWKKAGVTKAPATYKELTDALTKVKAANPSDRFSPIYFPGQNWYAAMQFVWDAGGDIATKGDGKWAGAFSSAEAQAGLADYKAFQNEFSAPSSRTVDAITPDQVQLFADHKASAIVATSGFIGRIKEANPTLTDASLGTFPLPGKSGKAQPVMLGGSDWGVAARSANAELALQWIKIAASPDVQKQWIVGHEGFIPNSLEGIESAKPTLNDIQKGFFAAALRSQATPASANWARIEGNKEINNLFSSIASGTKTPKDAASAFDAEADKTLNSTH